MPSLSPRAQTAVGGALIVLMIATRGHHFATIKQMLPSASWAAFFLAGVYLRPAWTLAALFGVAAFVDYAAVTWGGVDSFCVSPAYVGLIPAYGTLWLAGRWYAGRHRFEPRTLLPLVAAAFIGAAVCELISSGSFYYFSGRFTDPTLAEFALRLIGYFPAALGSMAFWIAVGAAAHVFAVTQRHRADAARP